jgi:DNA-binding protein H-NS
MDVKTMSISQLKELDLQLKSQLAEISDQIDLLAKRERNEAIEQIYGIAHSLGLPIRDLLPAASSAAPRKARAASGSYVDPQNPTNIWRGLGPRPPWLKAALAAGVRLDQLKAA